MTMTFTTSSHASLLFSPELPAGFSGIRLPGGTVQSAEGEFGMLCIQEFEEENYLIRYSVVEMAVTSDLRSHVDRSGYFIWILLRGKVQVSFNGQATMFLQEGQFTIMESSALTATTSPVDEQGYILLEIVLSNAAAGDILKLFPSLPSVPLYINPAGWTDTETKELVRQVFRYPHDKEWRRHYYGSRVLDIFFQLLVNHAKNDPVEPGVNQKEIDQAKAAEQLILLDLRKHFTIPELARKIGSNETKLKRAFRKVFDMGIYEYLVYHRLKKTVELLDQGYSVKETAAQTGWRPADLIKAYYKKYGNTPGRAKKRR